MLFHFSFHLLPNGVLADSLQELLSFPGELLYVGQPRLETLSARNLVVDSGAVDQSGLHQNFYVVAKGDCHVAGTLGGNPSFLGPEEYLANKSHNACQPAQPAQEGQA